MIHNTAIILAALCLHGPMTEAELARILKRERGMGAREVARALHLATLESERLAESPDGVLIVLFD